MAKRVIQQADLVKTGAFIVARDPETPADVARTLNELRATARPGVTPLVVCGGVVSLLLADFLAGTPGD